MSEEFECSTCNGTKKIKVSTWNGIDNPLETYVKCPTCKGTGKVDWIKHVMKCNIDFNDVVFEIYKSDIKK